MQHESIPPVPTLFLVLRTLYFHAFCNYTVFSEFKTVNVISHCGLVTGSFGRESQYTVSKHIPLCIFLSHK